jgi:large subunit ribosomal protein L6
MNFLNRKISFPKNVQITKTETGLTFSGPLGSNSIPLSYLDSKGNCCFQVDYPNNAITLIMANSQKSAKSLLRTLENIIKTQIECVIQGFSIGLEVIGVGYKFRYDKNLHQLSMKLGYTDECIYYLPSSVLVFQKNQTQIRLYGVDKEKVTQVASAVKQFFPPDPYKGKGIRYENETLNLKPGKKK